MGLHKTFPGRENFRYKIVLLTITQYHSKDKHLFQMVYNLLLSASVQITEAWLISPPSYCMFLVSGMFL